MPDASRLTPHASRLAAAGGVGWGSHFTAGRSVDIDKARALVEHELALIAELQYEPYFLTVYDVVKFARSAGHPLPGARLGRQLRGVLLPGHHRGRSRAHGHAVRALHLPRAQRAAGHRRGLRARAARGSHPVHLRQVRPRPRGARRHRHHLPAQERAARRGQGARARPGAGGSPGQEPGLVGRPQGAARALARDGLRPRQPRHPQARSPW